ncbi:MAG: sigma factor-like helix-turn-helix DNA-binding protein [Patescibacteria group bacterium]
MSEILDKVISSQQESEKSNISMSETVNTLLSLIRAREAEILRLRFGLFDEKKHTLEEIGKRMSLTRERVRQLEKIAKENIRAHKNFDGIISPARKAVTSVLHEHGGLASKSKIADVLILDEEIKNYQKALEFIVDNFIDEVKLVDSDLFERGWYIHEDYLDLASDVINEIKRLISERGKLIHEDELVKEFEKSEYYINKTDRFAGFLGKNENDLKKILNAYLDLSLDLGSTPFEQWGMNDWRSINPKRINDKIYLVLDWYGKPMHFREIAGKINEAKFDHKVAHPATIHNDLIADSRFVLIGRGVYALKEWGYKAGVVADIIEDILKKAGTVLSKDEIIEKVLEQRDVKSNTVILSLNKNERFVKEGNKYGLK